jgi:CopG antitoxin of type II toxin-antitoxin system
MRKQKQIDPIPDEFSTYEEAAEFWETHDTTDYPDAFRTVEVKSELRRRHYEVEIDSDVMRKLRARLKDISKLADREILALTELRMDPEADRRLSGLLQEQQAGTLSHLESAELAALMKGYELGLLRQSQALAEAVRRGLMAPLTP